MVPNVRVRCAKPIPPIHNSFAWVVAVIVPVTAAVLVPTEFPGAIWSSGLAARMP